MKNTKKVLIVTGSRAEYGLLKKLIQGINQSNIFTLSLVVTGMHLSEDFGGTYKEIEEEFNYEKVVSHVNSNCKDGICKSIGLGIIGFSEKIQTNNPDLLFVLGDRYESFAAATAAMVHNVPIAHCHG